MNMANNTNVVWANGKLTNSSMLWTIETLPQLTRLTLGFVRRTLNTVSASNPLYIVGMETTHFATGVGGWIDENTLYVDPVFITAMEDLAMSVAKSNHQTAIFRMDKVLATEYVPSTQPDTLLEKLNTYSEQYGGATACPVKDGYLIFSGEGEVIYL